MIGGLLSTDGVVFLCFGERSRNSQTERGIRVRAYPKRLLADSRSTSSFFGAVHLAP